MTIAGRIFDLLDKKGIGIADFIDMTGVSDRDICEWKRGSYNPNVLQIIKISDYMNVPADYLLKGE